MTNSLVAVVPTASVIEDGSKVIPPTVVVLQGLETSMVIEVAVGVNTVVAP